MTEPPPPPDPTRPTGGATAAGPAEPPASDEPTQVIGDRIEPPADVPDGPTAVSDGPTEVRGDAPTEVRGDLPTEVRGDATAGPSGPAFPSGGMGAPSGGGGFRSSAGFPPPPGAADGPPAGGADLPPGGAVPPGGFPPGGGVPPGGFPPGGFPPGAGAGGWAYGPGSPRRLARSTQRKFVGGVAGGLSEYTGVDPVLYRVLFGVLTLFGGSGILLYAAAWLFLPADDQPTSPVESLIGRSTGGSNRARDTAAAAAMVAAGLVLAGVVAVGDARDLALCLLVVGGAYFLLRNLKERRGGGPPQPIAPEPPPVAYQAFDVPPPAYGGTATITAPAPAQPVKAPKPKREHSILGVLTLCVLLVAVGITAAIDDGDPGGPDAQTYLAIATGIIGLGLLVGTFVGRARWLAWLGLPCLALLVVVSTSGVQLEGGAGDRAYSPTEASDVAQSYRLGVGSLRLDLTDVDLSEQLVRTELSLGVGNLEVVVPRTADVSIQGRSGIGEVLLFGERENGTSASLDVVDYGPGGDGRIDLVLDLDVNIGQVRVDRAEA